MDPRPTLTPSTRILSPTANGKLLIVLNPTDNVAVAIPVEGVYNIELIPTPAPLSVGMIVGITLLIPLVFLRISTFDFPGVTFIRN